MSIASTTHLNFRGTARQALEFYQTVFGGQLMVATYGDFGMPAGAPGADKVVFGQVENADGFRLMAYDIPDHDDSDVLATAGSTRRENGVTVTDRTFFQSLRADTMDEVQQYWDACHGARRSSSRWPRRRGARVSACSPTSSVLPGCSMSEPLTPADVSRRTAGRQGADVTSLPRDSPISRASWVACGSWSA